jgi:hypothetical protein
MAETGFAQEVDGVDISNERHKDYLVYLNAVLNI